MCRTSASVKSRPRVAGLPVRRRQGAAAGNVQSAQAQAAQARAVAALRQAQRDHVRLTQQMPSASAAATVAAAAASAATMKGVQMASPSSSPSSTSSGNKRPIIPACVHCRRSKVKCEGGIPCRRCLRLKQADTCERCVPQKRGRKRKTERGRGAAAKKSKAEPSPLASAHDSPMMTQRHHLVTSADERERDAVQRFTALTSIFDDWVQQVSRSPERTAVSRLVFFCTHVSNAVNKHVALIEHHPRAKQLVSLWMCSTLVQKVNMFLASLKPEELALEQLDLEAAFDSPQAQMERQVYSHLPQGVLVLPCYPWPFHSSAKPWANAHLADMLGYTVQDLLALCSREPSYEMLLSGSYAESMTAFWRAVRDGTESFTHTMACKHAHGHIVFLVATSKIKYMQGLPLYYTTFTQLQPMPAQSRPATTLAAAAAAAATTAAASQSQQPQSEFSLLPAGTLTGEPMRQPLSVPQLQDLALPQPQPQLHLSSSSSSIASSEVSPLSTSTRVTSPPGPPFGYADDIAMSLPVDDELRKDSLSHFNFDDDTFSNSMYDSTVSLLDLISDDPF